MTNLLLVESSAKKTLEKIVSSLSLSGARKINDVSTLPAHIKEYDPDLIVISLTAVTDDFINEFSGLANLASVPVMVFADDCNATHINKLVEADVSHIGINNLHSTCFENLIALARARFKQIQTLKCALEEARIQLEDRKQIDRAKAILIKTRNFNEDEAYHTLRKLAMGRNITLGEMARNVIAMADLLK